jgi:PPOX class probable F420-dependent enzyme
MSDTEWRSFVGEGTRTGKVATVRKDGRAHVAPVWFLVEGDEIVFVTESHTVKGRALQRDPRFSFCVDSDELPHKFVIFDAEAKITEDPEVMLDWSIKLCRRYVGDDKAEEFGKLYAQPGTLLIFGQIKKVIATVLE